MPIISIRDNENNRWKRNAKTKTKKQQKKPKQTKTENNKGATKAVVKGGEVNDFVVDLS